MLRDKSIAEPSFGFLSTLESPDYGHFGGYLIVSPLGRPVEFHCTSPVRPSRAQEILYGPTLKPYLIGEQIGGALLKAAKAAPCLILVDADALLVSRSTASSPVALVAQRPQASGEWPNVAAQSEDSCIASASSSQASRVCRFDAEIEAGGYRLILPLGFEGEKHAVAELATRLSRYVDLAEPFGRIHEAIREAQRIGGRAGETHGQAA